MLDPSTSDIPKHILAEVDERDTWTTLILTIVFELCKGNQSRRLPYFQVLPAQFDTLMFWSDDELKELRGSKVLDKIGKKSAEEGWKQTIIPVMQKHASNFVVNDQLDAMNELIDLCHTAGSLIMAYAFDIDRDLEGGSDGQDGFQEDDEENPLKGMVPFADMLNADATRNNAKIFQEDDMLIMRSIKPISKGEQIFNDYGPLPRSDLLRMYGYVTDQYAQYDVVELDFSSIAQIARSTSQETQTDWNKKLQELEQQDFFDDGHSMPRPRDGQTLEEAVPDDLRSVIKVLCAEKDPFKNVRGSVSIKESTVLAAIFEARLSEFPTSIAEDQKKLQDLEETWISPSSRSRYRMAIEVRKGEKEICVQMIQLCKERMDKIATSQMVRTRDSTKHNTTLRRETARNRDTNELEIILICLVVQQQGFGLNVLLDLIRSNAFRSN